MKKPAGKQPAAKAKKLSVKVNFEGVETRVLLPEGIYHARVDEITVEEGTEYQYLKWVFKTIDDDPKLNDKALFLNTSLSPKSLWNLRNLLETLGVETPDSEVDLEPETWYNLELMLKVQHEEYEGKARAKISDFTPLEESTEVADDDKPEVTEAENEEPDAVVEEEDDETKITEAEVRELDEKELTDLIKKHSLKVDLKKIAQPRKRLAAVIDALEAAGLLAE